MSDRRECSAITSMNPNPLRAERQLLCIQSWLNAGLRVVVVNTTEELSAMSLPDGVETAACDDLSTLYDRKTQLVSSLVRVGLETGRPFLLINSDIEISGDLTLLDEALKTPQELTIGIRYNHRPNEKSKAHLETSGLDAFLMTPELAATLPEAPFGIGKPVWDYWLPQHFRSLGVKFNWIRRPLFFHESHALGWSWEEWQQGADYILEKYGVVLGYGSNEFRRSLDKNISTEPVIVAESCKCELTGFCEARGIALRPTFQMLCRENKSRVDSLLSGEKPPEKKSQKRKRSCNAKSRNRCKDCSNAGTLMMLAIEAETGQPIKCGTCRQYVNSLNRTAQHNQDAIAHKLYAEISWPMEWRAKYRTKDAQKKRIAEIVSSVIASASKPPCVIKPRAKGRGGARRGRAGYTGWRSEADGPRILHGPFVSDIRHLTYHVWAATKHESWKWNIEQLAKRWELFNGKKVLGIAHDSNSVHPDVIRHFIDSLGLNFNHVIVRANDEKLREVVTWIPMLSYLSPGTASDREVVFSAHAKGQKYDAADHTRAWTDLMYQSCLDDWPSVYESLRTSLMTGSFREYGLLGKWNNWAYSGTFYWWRLAELGKRNWQDVDKWFAGTESWPGKMCLPQETDCLFLNDSRRMYDEQYWTDVVWKEWAKYMEARNGR